MSTKTMGRTATQVSYWTVMCDGEKLHEGLDFREAQAARREFGGQLVRVDFDASPGPSR